MSLALHSLQPSHDLEVSGVPASDVSDGLTSEATAHHVAESITVPLAHGRRLTVEPGADGEERVHVRSRSGQLEVALVFTAEGARLSIEAAELSLAAARSLTLTTAGSLTLAGDKIAVSAGTLLLQGQRGVELGSGADLRMDVSGMRHSAIGGADRTEAHSIETQANEGDLVLRARSDIRLDGEHIGLNDDPCPGPLPWTQAATPSARDGGG